VTLNFVADSSIVARGEVDSPKTVEILLFTIILQMHCFLLKKKNFDI
jgi:hypothetical protein